MLKYSSWIFWVRQRVLCIVFNIPVTAQSYQERGHSDISAAWRWAGALKSLFCWGEEVEPGTCQSSSWLAWRVLRHTCTTTKLHFWLPMHIVSPEPVMNKSFVYHPVIPLRWYLENSICINKCCGRVEGLSFSRVGNAWNPLSGINVWTHIFTFRANCPRIRTRAEASSSVPVSSEGQRAKLHHVGAIQRKYGGKEIGICMTQWIWNTPPDWYLTPLLSFHQIRLESVYSWVKHWMKKNKSVEDSKLETFPWIAVSFRGQREAERRGCWERTCFIFP